MPFMWVRIFMNDTDEYVTVQQIVDSMTICNITLIKEKPQYLNRSEYIKYFQYEWGCLPEELELDEKTPNRKRLSAVLGILSWTKGGITFMGEHFENGKWKPLIGHTYDRRPSHCAKD